MKYLFAPVHFVIGNLIKIVDFATSPKPVKRPHEIQNDIDEKCKNLTLYQYPTCPFCVRVKRNIKRLNLPIRMIDPRKDASAMDLLAKEGGKVQVPCLQITENDGHSTWMYESADINNYLDDQFAS